MRTLAEPLLYIVSYLVLLILFWLVLFIMARGMLATMAGWYARDDQKLSDADWPDGKMASLLEEGSRT